VSTSLTERKSFAISKREVWQAYERVKANKGAPRDAMVADLRARAEAVSHFR